MENWHNISNQKGGAAARPSASSLPAPGTVVIASVDEDLGEGRYALKVGQTRISVTSQTPLKIGQSLILRSELSAEGKIALVVQGQAIPDKHAAGKIIYGPGKQHHIIPQNQQSGQNQPPQTSQSGQSAAQNPQNAQNPPLESVQDDLPPQNGYSPAAKNGQEAGNQMAAGVSRVTSSPPPARERPASELVGQVLEPLPELEESVPALEDAVEAEKAKLAEKSGKDIPKAPPPEQTERPEKPVPQERPPATPASPVSPEKLPEKPPEKLIIPAQPGKSAPLPPSQSASPPQTPQAPNQAPPQPEVKEALTQIVKAAELPLAEEAQEPVLGGGGRGRGVLPEAVLDKAATILLRAAGLTPDDATLEAARALVKNNVQMDRQLVQALMAVAAGVPEGERAGTFAAAARLASKDIPIAQPLVSGLADVISRAAGPAELMRRTMEALETDPKIDPKIDLKTAQAIPPETRALMRGAQELLQLLHVDLGQSDAASALERYVSTFGRETLAKALTLVEVSAQAVLENTPALQKIDRALTEILTLLGDDIAAHEQAEAQAQPPKQTPAPQTPATQSPPPQPPQQTEQPGTKPQQAQQQAPQQAPQQLSPTPQPTQSSPLPAGANPPPASAPPTQPIQPPPPTAPPIPVQTVPAPVPAPAPDPAPAPAPAPPQFIPQQPTPPSAPPALPQAPNSPQTPPAPQTPSTPAAASPPQGQPSAPQPSAPQPSAPQPSLPQPSAPQPSLSQPSLPQPSLPPSSLPPPSAPPQGLSDFPDLPELPDVPKIPDLSKILEQVDAEPTQRPASAAAKPPQGETPPLPPLVQPTARMRVNAYLNAPRALPVADMLAKLPPMPKLVSITDPLTPQGQIPQQIPQGRDAPQAQQTAQTPQTPPRNPQTQQSVPGLPATPLPAPPPQTPQTPAPVPTVILPDEIPLDFAHHLSTAQAQQPRTGMPYMPHVPRMPNVPHTPQTGQPIPAQPLPMPLPPTPPAQSVPAPAPTPATPTPQMPPAQPTPTQPTAPTTPAATLPPDIPELIAELPPLPAQPSAPQRQGQMPAIPQTPSAPGRPAPAAPQTPVPPSVPQTPAAQMPQPSAPAPQPSLPPQADLPRPAFVQNHANRQNQQNQQTPQTQGRNPQNFAPEPARMELPQGSSVLQKLDSLFQTPGLNRAEFELLRPGGFLDKYLSSFGADFGADGTNGTGGGAPKAAQIKTDAEQLFRQLTSQNPETIEKALRELPEKEPEVLRETASRLAREEAEAMRREPTLNKLADAASNLRDLGRQSLAVKAENIAGQDRNPGVMLAEVPFKLNDDAGDGRMQMFYRKSKGKGDSWSSRVILDLNTTRMGPVLGDLRFFGQDMVVNMFVEDQDLAGYLERESETLVDGLWAKGFRVKARFMVLPPRTAPEIHAGRPEIAGEKENSGVESAVSSPHRLDVQG